MASRCQLQVAFSEGSWLPGETFACPLLFSAFELSEVCLGHNEAVRGKGEGRKLSSFPHAERQGAGA